MLEIQLGILDTRTTIGKIPVGTVFFGSLTNENCVAVFPHLRISGIGVVNLDNFQVIVNATEKTVIYNYTEVPDAILTRSSFAGLFDTLPIAACGDTSLRTRKEQLDSKETERT